MEATSPTRRISVVLLKVVGAMGALLVALLIFLVVGGQIVQQFHAPVNAQSLNVSVGLAAGSAFVGSDWETCKETRGGWKCEVSDQGGSGSYIYRVDVKAGSSCWDAELLRDYGEVPAPKRLSSCVNRFAEGWWGVIMG